MFDCAAECHDTSLNDKVLQGPDMMKKLVGVLMHFREHKVGLMGDIEQMQSCQVVRIFRNWYGN